MNEKNKFIKEVKWNGEKYTKSFIKHFDMMKGGVLEITMGPEPGKEWGKGVDDLPGRSVK
jgi:putative alpha-1,2-mannosidase